MRHIISRTLSWTINGRARDHFKRALQICREGNSGPREVSVHASLYAVPIYGKLGFEHAGPECTEDGITFAPMVFKFEPGG